jgi:hypothetical protein
VGARAPLPDDAREVRAALTDPRALCDALGLLDGPRSWSRFARGVIVRCPWHDERTPSCSVYRADDGTIAAKCHGCGASGDALSLVAAVGGLDLRRDFAAVLDEAARLAGVRLSSPSTGYTAPRPSPAPRPAPAPRERALEPLGDDAFAELADALLEMCPVEGEADARAYLEGRGVAELATAGARCLLTETVSPQVRDALVARFGRETWARCGLAHGDGPRAGDWLFAEHRLVIPWRAAGVSGLRGLAPTSSAARTQLAERAPVCGAARAPCDGALRVRDGVGGARRRDGAVHRGGRHRHPRHAAPSGPCGAGARDGGHSWRGALETLRGPVVRRSCGAVSR